MSTDPVTVRRSLLVARFSVVPRCVSALVSMADTVFRPAPELILLPLK